MKKLISTQYSPALFNGAMLLIRLSFGLMMMYKGYNKMVHFAEIKAQFIDFLGLGATFSLALVIFAEFFCSLFLILGLFTRLSTVPLIITMSVALFKVHQTDIFGKGEAAALFLAAYLLILMLGPGKVSVDGMTGK